MNKNLIPKIYDDEEFKPCIGYEDYLISNYGRVFSLHKNKFLSLGVKRDGYEYFIAYKNHKSKSLNTHRQVALLFVDGYNDINNVVNHKDENTLNNYYKNLEWCTVAYNNVYNGVNLERSKKLSKIVLKLDLNDNIIDEFYGLRNAAKSVNGHNSNIHACCVGKTKIYKSYKWQYKY